MSRIVVGLLLHCVALSSAFSYYNSLLPLGSRLQPTTTITVLSARRHLLQVTTDSISFSVVVLSNDTAAASNAIITNVNSTVEGYTSSAPPVYVPASCPANSISPPGSVSVTQCTCLPGYQGDASQGTDCLPCPINTFCASGKLGLCPAHAFAPVRSVSVMDCTCYPGFYGNGSVSCSLCPANSFCTGGFALEVCVQNAVSPVQSTSNASCYCDSGYFGVYNAPCELCSAGSWCWTGIKNSCPANSSSKPGASRVSDCACLDSFLDTPVTDNDNQSTSVCTVCPTNGYCKVLIPYITPARTFHTHAHTAFFYATIHCVSHHHLSGQPNLP